MKNLEILTSETASPEAQKIFESIKKQFGNVPNVYAAIGNSPAALQSLLGLGQSLRKGEFSDKEREAISLALAQENNCRYCLSAHTAIAKMAGFSPEEIKALRKAESDDNKIKALTILAKSIVATKGEPDQSLIDAFFSVGYSKGALVELIACIAKDIFTNYFNHIADTDIDFPEVED